MTRWPLWFIFFLTSWTTFYLDKQNGDPTTISAVHALKLAMPSFRSRRQQQHKAKRRFVLGNADEEKSKSRARRVFFKRRYRQLDSIVEEEDTDWKFMGENTAGFARANVLSWHRNLASSVATDSKNNIQPMPTDSVGRPMFRIDPRTLVAEPSAKMTDSSPSNSYAKVLSKTSDSSVASSAARSPLFRSIEAKIDYPNISVNKNLQEILEHGLTLEIPVHPQDDAQDQEEEFSSDAEDTAAKSPLFRPVSFAPEAPTRSASGDHIVYNVQQLREKVLDEGLPFKKILLQDDIFKRATTATATATTTTTKTTTASNTATSTPGTTTAGTSDSTTTTTTSKTTATPTSTTTTTTTNDDSYTEEISLLQNHTVIQLMVDRFHSGSTPGHRAPNDTARLALSMEGGGMRGAVSAGMASAVAALGLCDTLDVYYGSSAGSVIGAYMVSRQMVGMDIYVDILPTAKRHFVCLRRMLSSILATSLHGALSRAGVPRSLLMPHDIHIAPGMNISFVLDGIMHEKTGVRPLDLETFAVNNEKQPLRVASSYVQDGVLHTRSFGTDDFIPDHDSRNGKKKKKVDRKVLFDCLRASMTVPGATGPPVQMKHGNSPEGVEDQPEDQDSLDDDSSSSWAQFFDAFCFEPIPYRSAVQEGATHCLVFCSRPEDFIPKSKPGAYEKAIAPLYFESHGEPAVAQFFENGGQQYIYAEDLMTLEQGKHAGLEGSPVQVPPSTVLYGVERDAERQELATNRDETWNSAHLLPLKVPKGTPELATLEQDRDTVLHGVRGGFAAAYDLLAPAIGLDLEMSGHEVAKLLFPDDCLQNESAVLEQRLHVQGERIKDPQQQHSLADGAAASAATAEHSGDMKRPKSFSQAIQSLRAKDKKQNSSGSSSGGVGADNDLETIQQAPPPPPSCVMDEKKMAEEDQFRELLLEKLPGFRAGRMSYLAESLRGNSNEPSVAGHGQQLVASTSPAVP